MNHRQCFGEQEDHSVQRGWCVEIKAFFKYIVAQFQTLRSSHMRGAAPSTIRQPVGAIEQWHRSTRHEREPLFSRIKCGLDADWNRIISQNDKIVLIVEDARGVFYN